MDLSEITLYVEPGTYAVRCYSGSTYVLKVPSDRRAPGELAMRRADGVFSRPLATYQAQFAVGESGLFHVGSSDRLGVRPVRSPRVLAIRKLR